MAGTLRQRRLVGRIVGQLQRVAQHVAAKGLRRLREIDRLARQCFGDGPAHRLRRSDVGQDAGRHVRPRARALDGISSGHRGQRRAGLGRCGDRARDQIRARERPRGIVDDDEIARRVRHAERVRHRILPPLATRDEAQRLARATGREAVSGLEIRRRIVDERLRQRDDDGVDRRMREEGRDAALEDRPAADCEQLLRLRAAEPLSASTGRNDGGHMHGQTFIIRNAQRAERIAQRADAIECAASTWCRGTC